MKKIKQNVTDYEMATYISAGKGLADHIKVHPEKLESGITHLTDNEKGDLLSHFSDLGLSEQVDYLVEHGATLPPKNGYVDIINYLIKHGDDLYLDDD